MVEHEKFESEKSVRFDHSLSVKESEGRGGELK